MVVTAEVSREIHVSITRPVFAKIAFTLYPNPLPQTLLVTAGLPRPRPENTSLAKPRKRSRVLGNAAGPTTPPSPDNNNESTNTSNSSTTPANSSTTSWTEEDLRSKGVRELKEILRGLHVDSSGCVEKAELIALVIASATSKRD